MSWFLRGVQSAIFHYASCAPCTGYNDSRRRRREAKRARLAREQLVREQPETYYHPEPTGTNPFWGEEIALGPGPPPRRGARRTTASSTRGAAKAGASAVASQAGSSVDGERAAVRLSDDTLDDDTWNLKRYQREDEQLWGLDEAPVAVHLTASGSSSSGLGSMLGLRTSRPGTSRSGSYYSARAPPVNDLHPPVVSLPPPDAADSRWMLQPPPKASVMAGRERATHRSRSGSGASSRVELGLQRHASSRQRTHRRERAQTQELPPLTPQGSCTDLAPARPRHRSRTPTNRPRTDTPTSLARTATPTNTARTDTPTNLARTDTADSQHSAARGRTARTVSVRHSRPALSTVVSSGSGANASPPAHHTDENALPQRPEQSHVPDSLPAPRTSARPPLDSSDLSSLNCLQDTVSPRALLSSRFVSAPLVEAKIRLPPSTTDLAASARDQWNGGGFSLSRTWTRDAGENMPAPFDSRGEGEKDPTLRWSVDF